MSDEAAPVKRGRKAATDKAEKKTTEKLASAGENDKGDSKKRPRKEVAPAKPASTDNASGGDSEDGAAPVKRGRGRPKGSTKKKNATGGGGGGGAAKPKKGRGRGRPKKVEKEDSAEEEDAEDDANDDEDD